MFQANKLTKALFIVLLFSFIAVCLPGLTGHIWDNASFSDWAKYIHSQGLKQAYGSKTDYLPLYQYFLWVYGKLCGSEQVIGERIYMLRLITLGFEVLSIGYVYQWIDKKFDFLTLLIFTIFNIGFSYNTIIWGQIDGMLACMEFVAIYYAYNNKIELSFIWFLLAINLKLQAIIFFPIWALLLVSNIEKKKIKKLLFAVLIICTLQLIIFYPFILTATSKVQLKEAILGSIGRYPIISIFAYNIWYWIFPTDPANGYVSQHDDTILFLNMSCKNIGLLLFFLTSFIALFPLISNATKRILNKNQGAVLFKKERLWAICALIPLLFFFCNTQMHERYSHPAFIFLVAYSFYTKDFFPYILMSLAYFLNLEDELCWLKLKNYQTVIFDPKFIAGLYFLLIAYMYFRVYKPKYRIETH